MDFTHVNDVASGINRVVESLAAGDKNLPPIHFANGTGTTLGQLAQLAVSASVHPCVVNEVAARASSVGCFIGDPGRATQLLGWTHSTPLADGIEAMVRQFTLAATDKKTEIVD